MAAMRRTLRGPAALLVLALVAAACSGGDPDAEPGPATSVTSTTVAPSTTEAPSTTATASAQVASSAQFRAAGVRLVRVAELEQPVAMALRPG
jgi:ABC-type glycerol-3-phosphate transport system substrate-binding protein